MPSRILRDGILTSERVTSLDWPAEVFYRRLMSVVDDFGRYYATPVLLRSACYPLQIDKVSDADVKAWLDACIKANLVNVYKALDGKTYLELCDFRQQVRAKNSKFPSCDTQMHSTCTAYAPVDGDVVVVEDVFVDGDVVDISSQAKPECPHKEILGIYHEMLPSLPKVRMWTEKRAKALRARWNEDKERQSLDWWKRFFASVSHSDFLTGRKTDFQADLEWLLTAGNFIKVLEGKYENRQSPAQQNRGGYSTARDASFDIGMQIMGGGKNGRTNHEVIDVTPRQAIESGGADIPADDDGFR